MFRLKGVLLLIIATYFLLSCSSSQKIIFKDDFQKDKLDRKWKVENGDWTVQDGVMSGVRNQNGWGVILVNKKLPEDYILTFSAFPDSTAYFFEIILNLKKEKFLGILQNQMEQTIDLEDRSLFSPKNRIKQNKFVCTTGHIGALPEFDFQNQYDWLNWKIQKIGKMIYLWINDVEVMSFSDSDDLLNPKGKFGFIIHGKVQIKDVKLYETKKEASYPPTNFKGKPRKCIPFFFE
ncbi:hypothetical protein LJC00_02300 [Dysgonomonas sp. OttesenSCG-928-M03]|nr:hypothetical protein [Dysgonomonas sp. OttesenSCG-928-M03]